jgi:ABC-type multidrug transport system ATPase subunit
MTARLQAAVIDVGDLRMRYGRNEVLRGVSFQVHQGEVVSVLGPNGAGKTTAIEILEGFRMRSAGHVHELVQGIVRQGDTTILLTTHDLDEAEKLADRILILNRAVREAEEEVAG